MHLIQILLTLNDGDGRRCPAQSVERLAHELTEKFGGAKLHAVTGGRPMEKRSGNRA